MSSPGKSGSGELIIIDCTYIKTVFQFFIGYVKEFLTGCKIAETPSSDMNIVQLS